MFITVSKDKLSAAARMRSVRGYVVQKEDKLFHTRVVSSEISGGKFPKIC